MTVLKRILNYFIWTIIAFICASCYLWIILESLPNYFNGFTSISELLLELIFIYVVPIIGSIIALLYILIDIFYLNKKLKNNVNSTVIRLFFIIGITILLGATHYFLERVIDVI